MFMKELSFPTDGATDDAFFQPELGWSVWGSLVGPRLLMG